jgi:integrase
MWSYVSLLRGERTDEQLGRPKKRLLATAIDEYRRHRERTVADRTYATEWAALALLRDRFPRAYVHTITTEALQEIFNELHDAGYQPGTLATRRIQMSAFFKWAGGSNPAKGVKTVAVTHSDDPYAWSDADLKRLRKKAASIDTGVPLRLMLAIGLSTGVRRGELLALKWSDFDYKSKTVRVVRQFASGSTRVSALKGKRSRTAIVLPAFWEWYQEGDGYCIMRDGKPLRDSMVFSPFRSLLEACGLHGPGRGIHDARRTYGRLFLEAGGWMDELQRSLGHRSITTTERQYGQFQAEVAASFARDRIYGTGRLQLLR